MISTLFSATCLSVKSIILSIQNLECVDKPSGIWFGNSVRLDGVHATKGQLALNKRSTSTDKRSTSTDKRSTSTEQKVKRTIPIITFKINRHSLVQRWRCTGGYKIS